jgi:hypothetical protein
MNNDKNEPVVDAMPAEQQIVSLESDEIENVDLTDVSGGSASTHQATHTCIVCP